LHYEKDLDGTNSSFVEKQSWFQFEDDDPEREGEETELEVEEGTNTWNYFLTDENQENQEENEEDTQNEDRSQEIEENPDRIEEIEKLQRHLNSRSQDNVSQWKSKRRNLD